MPDLGCLILRKSVKALADDRPRCRGCRRTPLVGERLHEMQTGRVLCALCVAALPEDRREPVRSELVHATDRHLAVAPVAVAPRAA
jgi:hypothetical protein